ncbi:MAG: acyl-CoA carboxylase epsilon subunit [Streptosporangiaceae bacterium]
MPDPASSSGRGAPAAPGELAAAGEHASQRVLSVVRGAPTAAELAAVVAVLASIRAPSGGPATPASRPEWSARARVMRAPVTTGPGAWRSVALPR